MPPNITTSLIEGKLDRPQARGKLLGNPGLRARTREAIAETSRARREAHLAGLTATMSTWLPVVQRQRPDHPWEDVARRLEHELGKTGQSIDCDTAGQSDWKSAARWEPDHRSAAITYASIKIKTMFHILAGAAKAGQ